MRGMIPRLYAVFFIETMEFLAKAERIGKAQAVLGAMLGIKPFLTLEDGDLVPMEKVRTRQQAIEKLVEFVVEFSNIEHLAILQGSAAPSDDTRLLLERLALEFPGRTWPVLAYRPSLATFVGPNAMGVVVFEGQASPKAPPPMPAACATKSPARAKPRVSPARAATPCRCRFGWSRLQLRRAGRPGGAPQHYRRPLAAQF